MITQLYVCARVCVCVCVCVCVSSMSSVRGALMLRGVLWMCGLPAGLSRSVLGAT